MFRAHLASKPGARKCVPCKIYFLSHLEENNYVKKNVAITLCVCSIREKNKSNTSKWWGGLTWSTKRQRQRYVKLHIKNIFLLNVADTKISSTVWLNSVSYWPGWFELHSKTLITFNFCYIVTIHLILLIETFNLYKSLLSYISVNCNCGNSLAIFAMFWHTFKEVPHISNWYDGEFISMITYLRPDSCTFDWHGASCTLNSRTLPLCDTGLLGCYWK